MYRAFNARPGAMRESPMPIPNAGRPRFDASRIAALQPSAWYRFNQGITVATGVSAWADQSGNGRTLAQGTGGLQPAKQADGSILFDGVDDHLTAAFALVQPVTLYLVMKQVTWVSGRRVLDGGTALSVFASQNVSSPNINLNAGASMGQNAGAVVGQYVAMVFAANGANSLTQVNGAAPVTGDAGTNNPGGFTLAAQQGGGNVSNIQVKEVIIFAAAHDSATRAKVIGYLTQYVGLA